MLRDFLCGVVGYVWIVLMVAVCLGCSTAPARLTTEVLFPMSFGARDGLTVEWPKGVRSADVKTVEITTNGETRAVSVAPLPEITTGTIAGK
ncbi:MAG: hypothetical protein ABFD60_06995 [Bryobacteraceae bacterium]